MVYIFRKFYTPYIQLIQFFFFPVCIYVYFYMLECYYSKTNTESNFINHLTQGDRRPSKYKRNNQN